MLFNCSRRPSSVFVKVIRGDRVRSDVSEETWHNTEPNIRDGRGVPSAFAEECVQFLANGNRFGALGFGEDVGEVGARMDASDVEVRAVAEKPATGDVELICFKFFEGDEDGDGTVGEEVFGLNREEATVGNHVRDDKRLAERCGRASGIATTSPADDGKGEGLKEDEE